MKPRTIDLLLIFGFIVSVLGLFVAYREGSRHEPIHVADQRTVKDNVEVVLSERRRVTIDPLLAAGVNMVENRDQIAATISGSPTGPGGRPLVRSEALFPHSGVVRNSFLKATYANRRLDYANYVDRVGLSEDESNAFFAILEAREKEWMELCMKAGSAGRDLNDAVFREQDSESSEFYGTMLQKLLGEERYQKLQEYRDERTARHGIVSLEALVLESYYSGESLPQDMLNVLARICADENIFAVNSAILKGTVPDFEKVRGYADSFLPESSKDTFGLIIDSQMYSFWRARNRTMGTNN